MLLSCGLQDASTCMWHQQSFLLCSAEVQVCTLLHEVHAQVAATASCWCCDGYTGGTMCCTTCCQAVSVGASGRCIRSTTCTGHRQEQFQRKQTAGCLRPFMVILDLVGLHALTSLWSVQLQQIPLDAVRRPGRACANWDIACPAP